LFLIRPYFYPVFLSIHKMIGIAGFQLFQIILNVISIFFIYNSILLLTNKKYISIIFSTILAITPTFNLIVYYALTETLTIFILSLFIYFFTKGYINKEIREYFFAGITISLLVCIKGNFLPFFFIYFIFLCYNLNKIKNKKTSILMLIIILIPILIQLANTYALTGNPTISIAGEDNFNNRFFPVVYGFGESQNKNFIDYKSEEARTADIIYPDTASKLTYIIKNPGALIKTYHYLLVYENLLTDSNFVKLPGNLVYKNATIESDLKKFSRDLNKYFYNAHIIFIFVMFLFLLSKTTSWSLKSYLIILYLLMFSLLLASPLVYWQGDRIILIAEPVWLIIYSYLTSFLINRVAYIYG